MAWTVPNLFVAGATLAAAELNKIRDSLKAIGDPWTAYTPTWTASTTNPTIGNGTIAGAYLQAGQFVSFRLLVTWGSTTTNGTGTYSVTLPVAPKSGMRWAMTGVIYDLSATDDFPILATNSGGSTTVVLKRLPTTAGAATIGIGPTAITWATGDQIALSGVYEV